MKDQDKLLWFVAAWASVMLLAITLAYCRAPHAIIAMARVWS